MKISYDGVELDSNKLSHEDVYGLMKKYFEFIQEDLNNPSELRFGRSPNGTYLVSRYRNQPNGFRVLNLIPFTEVEMIKILQGYFTEWMKRGENEHEEI